MEEQNAQDTGVGVIEKDAAPLTQISPYIPANVDRALIEEVMAENLGATGMSEFDLQRIKMPSGGTQFFELQGPETVEPAAKFRCIILKARDTRGYWAKSIDESGGGQPPECHSHDCRTGIGTPGGDCGQCSLAQFGSGKKGSGQACKQTKQLFIVRQESGSILPEVFNVPPTSLKTYRKFSSTLAGRLTPVTGVIVEVKYNQIGDFHTGPLPTEEDRAEVTLSKEKSDGGQEYSQAHFAVVGVLNPDERKAVKAHASMFMPLFDHSPAIAARSENVRPGLPAPGAPETVSQNGGAF